MGNSILKILSECFFYSTKEAHAWLKAMQCLKAYLGSELETWGRINNLKVIIFTLFKEKTNVYFS